MSLLVPASSSSYALSPPKKYDVFISFRGYDTRYNFVCHLRKALRDKQIRTFLDEQIPKGDDIPPSLLQAIEDSYTSIVVFSENFASSTSCLNELVHILHCKWDQGQTFVPVFYKVEPTDVRHQSGPYQQAFQRYKADPRSGNRVDRWERALRAAANIAGYDTRTFRDDSRMIEKIVKDILNCDHQQAGTFGKRETICSSSKNPSRFLENPGMQRETVMEERVIENCMRDGTRENCQRVIDRRITSVRSGGYPVSHPSCQERDWMLGRRFKG